MFAVRIVKVEHYLASPIRGLDPCYSDFRNCQLAKVPVVRIFGSTPAGQKTCVHLHGIFPYIYIPYDGTKPVDRYVYQLAVNLEHALTANEPRAAECGVNYVYKVEVVSGTPFYGYHVKEHQFLKIYFLNPQIVERAVELLQNGSIMNRVFQPHEAHIPYILQMFIDYNLYGMNLIKFHNVKFRRKKVFICEEQASSLNPLDPLPLLTTDSSTANVSFRLWDPDQIPSSYLLEETVMRQSTCELEVDAVAADVLNSLELAGSDMNPGIAAIWEDERLRRRQLNESSQLTPPVSQARQPKEITGTELLYMEKINIKLQLATESPEDESLLDESQVHDHCGIEAENVEVTLPSESILDESVLVSTQKSSQVSLNAEDQEVLNMLLDLMDTESVCSEKEAYSPPPSPIPETTEVDKEDELQMSAVVWDNELDADMQSDNTKIDANEATAETSIPQVDGPSDPDEHFNGSSKSKKNSRSLPNIPLRRSPRNAKNTISAVSFNSKSKRESSSLKISPPDKTTHTESCNDVVAENCVGSPKTSALPIAEEGDTENAVSERERIGNTGSAHCEQTLVDGDTSYSQQEESNLEIGNSLQPEAEVRDLQDGKNDECPDSEQHLPSAEDFGFQLEKVNVEKASAPSPDIEIEAEVSDLLPSPRSRSLSEPSIFRNTPVWIRRTLSSNLQVQQTPENPRQIVSDLEKLCRLIILTCTNNDAVQEFGRSAMVTSLNTTSSSDQLLCNKNSSRLLSFSQDVSFFKYGSEHEEEEEDEEEEEEDEYDEDDEDGDDEVEEDDDQTLGRPGNAGFVRHTYGSLPLCGKTPSRVPNSSDEEEEEGTSGHDRYSSMPLCGKTPSWTMESGTSNFVLKEDSKDATASAVAVADDAGGHSRKSVQFSVELQQDACNSDAEEVIEEEGCSQTQLVVREKEATSLPATFNGLPPSEFPYQQGMLVIPSKADVCGSRLKKLVQAALLLKDRPKEDSGDHPIATSGGVLEDDNDANTDSGSLSAEAPRSAVVSASEDSDVDARNDPLPISDDTQQTDTETSRDMIIDTEQSDVCGSPPGESGREPVSLQKERSDEFCDDCLVPAEKRSSGTEQETSIDLPLAATDDTRNRSDAMVTDTKSLQDDNSCTTDLNDEQITDVQKQKKERLSLRAQKVVQEACDLFGEVGEDSLSSSELSGDEDKIEKRLMQIHGLTSLDDDAKPTEEKTVKSAVEEVLAATREAVVIGEAKSNDVDKKTDSNVVGESEAADDISRSSVPRSRGRKGSWRGRGRGRGATRGAGRTPVTDNDTEVAGEDAGEVNRDTQVEVSDSSACKRRGRGTARRARGRFFASSSRRMTRSSKYRISDSSDTDEQQGETKDSNEGAILMLAEVSPPPSEISKSATTTYKRSGKKQTAKKTKKKSYRCDVTSSSSTSLEDTEISLADTDSNTEEPSDDADQNGHAPEKPCEAPPKSPKTDEKGRIVRQWWERSPLKGEKKKVYVREDSESESTAPLVAMDADVTKSDRSDDNVSNDLPADRGLGLTIRKRFRKVYFKEDSDSGSNSSSLKKADVRPTGRTTRRTRNSGWYGDILELSSERPKRSTRKTRNSGWLGDFIQVVESESEDYGSSDRDSDVHSVRTPKKRYARRSGVDYSPFAYRSFFQGDTVVVDGRHYSTKEAPVKDAPTKETSAMDAAAAASSALLLASSSDEAVEEDTDEQIVVKNCSVRLERLDQATLEKYLGDASYDSDTDQEAKVSSLRKFRISDLKAKQSVVHSDVEESEASPFHNAVFETGLSVIPDPGADSDSSARAYSPFVPGDDFINDDDFSLSPRPVSQEHNKTQDDVDASGPTPSDSTEKTPEPCTEAPTTKTATTAAAIISTTTTTTTTTVPAVAEETQQNLRVGVSPTHDLVPTVDYRLTIPDCEKDADGYGTTEDILWKLAYLSPVRVEDRFSMESPPHCSTPPPPPEGTRYKPRRTKEGAKVGSKGIRKKQLDNADQMPAPMLMLKKRGRPKGSLTRKAKMGGPLRLTLPSSINQNSIDSIATAAGAGDDPNATLCSVMTNDSNLPTPSLGTLDELFEKGMCNLKSPLSGKPRPNIVVNGNSTMQEKRSYRKRAKCSSPDGSMAGSIAGSMAGSIAGSIAGSVRSARWKPSQSTGKGASPMPVNEAAASLLARRRSAGAGPQSSWIPESSESYLAPKQAPPPVRFIIKGHNKNSEYNAGDAKHKRREYLTTEISMDDPLDVRITKILYGTLSRGRQSNQYFDPKAPGNITQLSGPNTTDNSAEALDKAIADLEDLKTAVMLLQNRVFQQSMQVEMLKKNVPEATATKALNKPAPRPSQASAAIASQMSYKALIAEYGLNPNWAQPKHHGLRQPMTPALRHPLQPAYRPLVMQSPRHNSQGPPVFTAKMTHSMVGGQRVLVSSVIAPSSYSVQHLRPRQMYQAPARQVATLPQGSPSAVRQSMAPPQSPLSAAGQSMAPPQSPLSAAGQSMAPPQSPLSAAGQSMAPPQSPMSAAGQSMAPPQSPLSAAGQSMAPPQSPLSAVGQSMAPPQSPLSAVRQPMAPTITQPSTLHVSTGAALRAMSTMGVDPTSTIPALRNSGTISNLAIVKSVVPPTNAPVIGNVLPATGTPTIGALPPTRTPIISSLLASTSVLSVGSTLPSTGAPAMKSILLTTGSPVIGNVLPSTSAPAIGVAVPMSTLTVAPSVGSGVPLNSLSVVTPSVRNVVPISGVLVVKSVASSSVPTSRPLVSAPPTPRTLVTGDHSSVPQMSSTVDPVGDKGVVGAGIERQSSIEALSRPPVIATCSRNPPTVTTASFSVTSNSQENQTQLSSTSSQPCQVSASTFPFTQGDGGSSSYSPSSSVAAATTVREPPTKLQSLSNETPTKSNDPFVTSSNRHPTSAALDESRAEAVRASRMGTETPICDLNRSPRPYGESKPLDMFDGWGSTGVDGFNHLNFPYQSPILNDGGPSQKVTVATGVVSSSRVLGDAAPFNSNSSAVRVSHVVSGVSVQQNFGSSFSSAVQCLNNDGDCLNDTLDATPSTTATSVTKEYEDPSKRSKSLATPKHTVDTIAEELSSEKVDEDSVSLTPLQNSTSGKSLLNRGAAGSEIKPVDPGSKLQPNASSTSFLGLIDLTLDDIPDASPLTSLRPTVGKSSCVEIDNQDESSSEMVPDTFDDHYDPNSSDSSDDSEPAAADVQRVAQTVDTPAPVSSATAVVEDSQLEATPIQSFYAYDTPASGTAETFDGKATEATEDATASIQWSEDKENDIEMAPQSSTVTQDRILTYVIRPPNPRDILASMAAYGIPEMRYPEAYCSDARDVPAKPMQLGGGAIVLKLKSNALEELAEFDSTLGNTGLSHWRQVLTIVHEGRSAVCKKDCAKSSAGFGRPLLYSGLCLELFPRPPSPAAVQEWLDARTKTSKTATTVPVAATPPRVHGPSVLSPIAELPEPVLDGNDDEMVSSTPHVADGQRPPSANTLTRELEDALSPIIASNANSPVAAADVSQPSPGANELSTKSNKRKRQLLPDLNDVFDRCRAGTQLDYNLQRDSDTFSSEVPRPRLKRSFSEGDSPGADSESIKSPSLPQLKKLKATDDTQSSVASPGADSESIKSPSLSQLKKLEATDDTQSSVASLGADSESIKSPSLSQLKKLKATDDTQSSVASPGADSESINSPSLPQVKKLKATNDTPSSVASPSNRPRVRRSLSYTDDGSLRRQLFLQKIKSNFPSQEKAISPDTSQLDGPSPKNTYGFKLSAEALNDAQSSHMYQYLTLMSMELHVRTDEDLNPNPKNNPICAVFYYLSHDIPPDNGQNKLQKITGIIIAEKLATEQLATVVADEQDPAPSTSTAKQDLAQFYRKAFSKHSELIEDAHVVVVLNEFALIQEFVKVVLQHDPDILLGYEIQLLSWGFLIERATVLGLKLCASLSRVPDDPLNVFKQLEEGKGAKFTMNIVGRIMLSIGQIMQPEVALYNYSFENVAYHILHKRIPLYSFHALTKWFDEPAPLNRWRTVQHYVVRVQGNVHLLEQLNIIGRTSELARLFGIQFYEVFSRGSQFRVESMMLRLCRRKKYVAISPSVQQIASMNAPEYIALVMEPISKFYTNPVVVLDFQSLYPSMMIAYNYCFSTCLGKVDSVGQPDVFKFGCSTLKVPAALLKKLHDQITVAPCGSVFVKSSVRKGILPRMLEEILAARIMVKTAMKRHKNDKALYRMLDARQLGLKLIANVTYGYTAANFSGRMPCVDIADAIVSKARETLERAIELIHNNNRWKAKVVYGDTDSVFVLLEGRSKEQAFAIGQEIADAVTADNPKPVKLKLEKVYLPCVLQTKKRYVGFMYESPDQAEAVYDAKGIETVRRDGCPAVAKILEKSIKLLFRTYDVSQVKSYVQHQFTKLLKGRSSLSDYVFTREYRGRHGYQNESHAPALKIAKQLWRNDPRAEPVIGERVPYVIVYGSPGSTLIELVRNPQDVLLNPSLHLNAKYYICNAICPALGRVFSLLGADVQHWYATLPRITRYSMPHDNQPREVGTISQYFVPANCPVCDGEAQTGLCLTCVTEPQKSAIVLTEHIRDWERRYYHTAKVCQGCTGTLDPQMACVSLDCPVLFRLAQATRDLAQASYLRGLVENFSISW